MGAFYDITGNKYGKLTVIKRIPNISARTTRWLCKCDCGKLHEVNKNNLINGKVSSCGCYAKELMTRNKYRETHSQSRTRLYFIWQGMKQRCFDKNVKEYRRYGAKGITVCNEWMRFENFYQWAMLNGYTDNLSIDRIDGRKNYEPLNCRWVSQKKQNRNKLNNRILELDGVEKCVGEWCEIYNLPMSTVINRLNRGCAPEEALNTNYRRRTGQKK
jgi:hypothetical protein